MRTDGNGMRKREVFLSALFPPRCPVCDEPLPMKDWEGRVHPACRKKLTLLTGAVCMRCGKPVGDRAEYCYDCSQRGDFGITQAKALFSYRGPAKGMMYRFKYAGRQEYASFFAKEAGDRLGEWIRGLGVQAIVPVPMYQRKQRQRGYNQAQLFARELSREVGVRADVGHVCRVRNTRPLKGLTPAQRRENLKNAFSIKNSEKKYNRILILDDIYTTGSTAEAVAGVLHAAGTQRVYMLSVCIGQGYE